MQAAVAMEKETDRVRFTRIAQEHHRMLLVYARTLLRDEGQARELVQDTLVTAWKNLTRFDVTRDIGSWLRGIVRNKWREHCRREGRRAEFAVGDPGSIEADLAAWERLKDKPLFEALQDCRERLPGALAEAVQAFYYDGLSGAEAAARLEVNEATLRKRLERARHALHDCMESVI